MNKERDIQTISKEELLSPGFIPSVFEQYPDEKERKHVLGEVLAVAKSKNVLRSVNKKIKDCMLSATITNNTIYTLLALKDDDVPEPTISNYVTVMQEDDYIKDLFYFDAFTGHCMRKTKDVRGNQLWEDKDDAMLKEYIETHYNMYSPIKYYDAFSSVLQQRVRHPLKEIIEKDMWDGVPRIDKFLADVLGCEDNDYNREVSRMIFYGGISRLYNPGCKFDYMPIFIGKQGTGKSTIVQWLALNDNYHRTISSIEGKDALEILEGAWICEMPELLAMVKTKEVEAMKSYLTITVDTFRKSYGKRTSANPRTCIFIGTTNNPEFLTDKTGNRRFLPVNIKLHVGDLFAKKDYVKNYILECWREALDLFNSHKTYLNIPLKYLHIVEEEQEKVMEDDPKVGLIDNYLKEKEIGYKVCGLELYTNCFSGLSKNYSRNESREITKIMMRYNNWERCDKTARLQDYGVQRYWVKIK